MTKPRIFKGKFTGIWHCVDEEGYCGSGHSIKSSYKSWVTYKKAIKMPYNYELWEPPIKPWEYQDNPKEDYSDLVWYKRWWKRFTDIWKGD